MSPLPASLPWVCELRAVCYSTGKSQVFKGLLSLVSSALSPCPPPITLASSDGGWSVSPFTQSWISSWLTWAFTELRRQIPTKVSNQSAGLGTHPSLCRWVLQSFSPPWENPQSDSLDLHPGSTSHGVQGDQKQPQASLGLTVLTSQTAQLSPGWVGLSERGPLPGS